VISIMQVTFLPWAGLQEEYSVGPVTFWPYFDQAAKKVSDTKIKEHLDSYFNCYVDEEGKPVKTINICTHGVIDFRDYNENDLEDIRRATNALIISAICPAIKNAISMNNRSMGPPTSERYQLIFQKFDTSDRSITIGSRSSKDMRTDFQKIRFSKPLCLGGHFIEPEEKIFNLRVQELIQAGVESEKAEFSCQIRLFWYTVIHYPPPPIGADGGSRRIAVLGDMRELGKYEIEAHRAIGNLAAECCDILITVGTAGKIIAGHILNSARIGLNIITG